MQGWYARVTVRLVNACCFSHGGTTAGYSTKKSEATAAVTISSSNLRLDVGKPSLNANMMHLLCAPTYLKADSVDGHQGNRFRQPATKVL